MLRFAKRRSTPPAAQRAQPRAAARGLRAGRAALQRATRAPALTAAAAGIEIALETGTPLGLIAGVRDGAVDAAVVSLPAATRDCTSRSPASAIGPLPAAAMRKSLRLGPIVQPS